MVVLMVPILRITQFAENWRWKALKESKGDDPPKTDWNEVSTVILGTTCGQGYEIPFYSVSARIVLTIALFVLMFLHSRLVIIYFNH